jgi:hypothetical protein
MTQFNEDGRAEHGARPSSLVRPRSTIAPWLLSHGDNKTVAGLPFKGNRIRLIGRAPAPMQAAGSMSR